MKKLLKNVRNQAAKPAELVRIFWCRFGAINAKIHWLWCQERDLRLGFALKIRD